jgi:hypothetical protein
MVFGEKISHRLKKHGATQGMGVAKFGGSDTGSNQLMPLTGSNIDGKNALRFVNCMKNVTGNALTIYGEKETTDVIYLCDIKPDTYNFTNNFTILSGSGRNMVGGDTGRRMGGFISSSYTGIDGTNYSKDTPTLDISPTTYITGVQLYDHHGTPVAVASLSTPWKKDVNRELIIKVKLTF